jgi:hypothetical protein
MAQKPDLARLTSRYREARRVADALEVQAVSHWRSLADFRAYAKRGPVRKWETACDRVSKTASAIHAWLDANSPWDWASGVSSRWTCENVTEALALSETAPTLPADAAGYGMPGEAFTLGRNAV